MRIAAMLCALLEVFAISSPRTNELNAAFTPDGRTIYFTRTRGAKNETGVIHASEQMKRGRWSSPKIASFSGHFSDFDPFVTPDGARLFFISNRPLHGETAKSDFDIWVVARTNRGWSEPQNVTVVNSDRDRDELYPAVAADGTLYFSSCGSADSIGRCDLYRSQLRNGAYSTPTPLGAPINTPASETDAYISPDQSLLIFTAYGRPDATGDGDLYISHSANGTWTEPRPLNATINQSPRVLSDRLSRQRVLLLHPTERRARGCDAGAVGGGGRRTRVNRRCVNELRQNPII